MISKLHRRINARAQGDEGIAMILVMGSIVTLTLLMTGSLAYALNAQTQSRNDQDWHAALAAAQAGVDDYAAKLNANAQYWRTVDCTNAALEGPRAGTNTCGWTSQTPVKWKKVQAGTDQSARFHYEVNTGQTSSGGGIRLTVTGRSRDELRTLNVKVGKDGSTKFVYYTDFESADPANRTSYPSGTEAQCGSNGTAQARYIWSDPARSQSRCNEIMFASADVLDGKVHFNDTPMMQNGATFLKGFETAAPNCANGTRTNNWAGCSRNSSGSPSGRPNIPNGQFAEYAGALYLPDNSDQLKTDPGCHYQGDTRIKFTAPASGPGKMTVWSKGTTSVEPGCGLPGTGVGRLGSTGGATVDVPDRKIVYAANKTTQQRCTTGQIDGVLPLENDENFGGTMGATFYCGFGNMYVEGTVKGSVGIGAENNVIVTGNVLVDGVAAGATPTGPNMVSLVASNSVVVYHPYGPTSCSRRNTDGTCRTWGSTKANLLPNANRYIYASIQTLQRSFWVQGYNLGARIGDLVVYGSIAQRWRGAVGISNGGGYDKDYRYDQRLSNDVPPGIQDFTNGAWGTTVTGEFKPAYACNSTNGTDTCTAVS